MADRLIFEIAVDISKGGASFLKAANGEVAMIPFGGTVTGPLFNGKVLPGGVDVQTVNANGVRHMCARYMLEGVDDRGDKCRIFIENNGWFAPGPPSSPFKTIPTFLTDSVSLAPLLHSNRFRGEGHPRDGGVMIKLFEIE